MFDVNKVFPLIEERQLFPNIAAFQQFDVLEDKTRQQYYFRLLPQTGESVYYFENVQQTRQGRTQSSIFLFNQALNHDAQFQRYGRFEYVNCVLTYVRVCDGKVTAVSYKDANNRTMTEFHLQDSKVLSVTAPDHYIHLLNEDYFVQYDPKGGVQLGSFRR